MRLHVAPCRCTRLHAREARGACRWGEGTFRFGHIADPRMPTASGQQPVSGADFAAGLSQEDQLRPAHLLQRKLAAGRVGPGSAGRRFCWRAARKAPHMGRERPCTRLSRPPEGYRRRSPAPSPVDRWQSSEPGHRAPSHPKSSELNEQSSELNGFRARLVDLTATVYVYYRTSTHSQHRWILPTSFTSTPVLPSRSTASSSNR